MRVTYLYLLITLRRVQRVVRLAKAGRHQLLRERLLHLRAVSNLQTEGDFYSCVSYKITCYLAEWFCTQKKRLPVLLSISLYYCRFVGE